LVAGGARQRLDEAVEPRRLANRDAGGSRALGEAGIIRLPPLFADPRRSARAVMADLGLRIELAGALGDIVAGSLARAGVDAGAFARDFRSRAVGGADLRRGGVGFDS
jgi:hypothetical protein